MVPTSASYDGSVSIPRLLMCARLYLNFLCALHVVVRVKVRYIMFEMTEQYGGKNSESQFRIPLCVKSTANGPMYVLGRFVTGTIDSRNGLRAKINANSPFALEAVRSGAL